MRKKIFELLKDELKHIATLFLVTIMILKIIFFKEGSIILFRIVLSLFWMFVLPGYFIMIYWKEKLDFIERIVVGIAISASLIGIFSYYIGLIGLNIKYHTILLPLVVIFIGGVLGFKKSNINS